MTEEARELHRIIGATVRDMVSVYRLQAQMGPVTVQALEEILLRAAHGVVQSLAPYSGEQRIKEGKEGAHWPAGRSTSSVSTDCQLCCPAPRSGA